MIRKTPITATREYYSDIPTEFTLNPVNGDLTRKVNEEAVKQSILNLLLTSKGEIPFQPNVGSDLYSVLFDNASPNSVELAKDLIKETIENFEPRADLIDVELSSVNELDNNGMNLTIAFYIINSEEPVTFTTFLTRIR